MQQLGRRRFLCLALTLPLAGCGGGWQLGFGPVRGSGGDGSGEGTRSVPVSLALPAGFPLAATALQVETGFGAQLSAASGTFNATISATADLPTLAWARTADSVVLLGFLGAAGGTETLDARSTALALLYVGLGGYMLPSTNTRKLLSLLSAHAALNALTTVLAQRLVANPAALMSGDAVLGAALKTAMNTILAERPRSGRAVMAPHRSRDVIPALTLIEPSALQSNVELVQGNAAQTFLATNHGRRYCQVRLYEVGMVDASGARTDYPKAHLVGGDLYSLGSTRALGIASTIFGFFSGTTAFVPVSTAPLPLTMAAGARKTFFEAVVLGSSFEGAEPAFFSDPRYVDERENWRSSVRNLNLTSWFFDIIFGILLELWGLRDLAVSSSAIEGILVNLRQLEVAAWLDIVTAAEAGNFSAATTAFWKLLSSNSQFVKSLQAVLATLSPQIQAIIGKEASAASLQLVTKAMTAAFAAVGVVLGAGDLGAVLWDLSNAQRAERWALTLVQPTVSLSPTSKSIAPGQRVTFGVKVPTGIPGTVVYSWSHTSAFATFSSSDGVVGNAIETTSTTVDLVTTPSDQTKITVSVVAYQRDAKGTRTEIGRSQAVVTFSSSTTTVHTDSLIVTAPISTGPDAGKKLMYALYTATVPSGNWTFAQLTTNSGTPNFEDRPLGVALERVYYDKGAPVVGDGIDAAKWVPYEGRQTGTSQWVNLGKGTIAFLFLGSGAVIPGYEQASREALQKQLDKNLDVKVTFS